MINKEDWIEVKKKQQPNIIEHHLLLCKRNHRNKDSKVIKQGHYENDKFYIDGGLYDGDYISHWMYLQKP